MEVINQYGPVVGLTIITTLAILRVLIALGFGQAAKVTADAALTNAQAASRQAEAETQQSMNSIALKMIDHQQASGAQYNQLADKFREVEVQLAGVNGEYKAHRENQDQLNKSWQQQTTLIEEMRQIEKKHADRLEAEISNLRGDVERALVSLSAANAVSEERRRENEELKTINSALQEDKGNLHTKMQGLAEQLASMEQENESLRELPARVQELELKNAKLQERITVLEGEVKPRHEDYAADSLLA